MYNIIILLIIVFSIGIVLLVVSRKIKLNRVGKYASQYSGIVEVFKLNSGEKRLLINNCVQGISPELPTFKESYWGQISEKAITFLKSKNNPVVLHVGLGANTIPKRIQNIFPDISQKIIEIDPAIIQACRDHFELDKLTNTKVIQSDIFNIINKKHEWNNLFSVIITDIYTNDPQITTAPENKFEFLEQITQWLKKDGMLIFARPSHTQQYRQEAQALEEYLKKQFITVTKKYIKDPRGFENYVLTATQTPHTKHQTPEEPK